MRQREQVERVWYVSWDDGYGDKGQLPFVGSSKTAHWQADQLRNDAKDPKRGKHYGVRVHRVTRCRLAPLVEVKAWRHHNDGWSRCGAHTFGTREPHAIVNRAGGGSAWRWYVVADGVEVAGRVKTKRAAMAAAEAHLAVLGYRVAKEKRRC